MKKLDAYTVMVKLKIECDLSIQAESLEDAIAKARDLHEDDFITTRGNLLDSDLHINGVFEE